VAASVGRARGLEVVEVIAGSPADAAGVRPEDLVIAVGDDPVGGVADLQRLLTAETIDRPVEVAVVRGGAHRRLTLVPRELAMR
jgi:S1-C subfamily serine protease